MPTKHKTYSNNNKKKSLTINIQLLQNNIFAALPGEGVGILLFIPKVYQDWHIGYEGAALANLEANLQTHTHQRDQARDKGCGHQDVLVRKS